MFKQLILKKINPDVSQEQLNKEVGQYQFEQFLYDKQFSVWNQALYNYDASEFWEYQEKLLKQLLKFYDMRLDHFVRYVNRAAILFSYTTAKGKVLTGADIFKPVKDGGMGTDFFLKDWIEDVYTKKSPKNENIFELFIRCAKEIVKKPEDTYILEDFGPLSKTKLYKSFKQKYGKSFISQIC